MERSDVESIDGIGGNEELLRIMDEGGDLVLSSRYDHVPESFVLCDRTKRDYENGDFDESVDRLPPVEQEILWMDKVDEVFETIESRQEGGYFVDWELKSYVKQVLLLIQRRHFACGLRPYTDSEITILAWECWYTDELWEGRFRHGGEPYSRSHLFGALMNAVRVLGITDLPFLPTETGTSAR